LKGNTLKASNPLSGNKALLSKGASNHHCPLYSKISLIKPAVSLVKGDALVVVVVVVVVYIPSN